MHGLEEGQKFERYRIIRRLGNGVSGESYEAEDTWLQRKVTLKLIHPWSTLSDSARRQFFREMQSISSITHRYLASVLDYGEVDGRLYIARRYVTAGSLLSNEGRLWFSPPLTVANAISYLHQLAQALQHIHDHGYLHGAVTLSNILILRGTNPDNEPDFAPFLLSDIGSAHFVRRFGRPKITFLPITASPEQLGSYTTQASDQYALAILLYLWLAGRPPFLGSPEEIEQLKLSETFTPLSSLNPQVTTEQDDILRRALSVYPEERYPSILTFANALRATLPARPVVLPLKNAEIATTTATINISPEPQKAAATPDHASNANKKVAADQEDKEQTPATTTQPTATSFSPNSETDIEAAMFAHDEEFSLTAFPIEFGASSETRESAPASQEVLSPLEEENISLAMFPLEIDEPSSTPDQPVAETVSSAEPARVSTEPLTPQEPVAQPIFHETFSQEAPPQDTQVETVSEPYAKYQQLLEEMLSKYGAITQNQPPPTATPEEVGAQEVALQEPSPVEQTNPTQSITISSTIPNTPQSEPIFPEVPETPEPVVPLEGSNEHARTVNVQDYKLFVPEPEATIAPRFIITSPYLPDPYEVLLERPVITIGRAGSSDILLDKDNMTSRHHALLKEEDGRYVIFDQRSAKGVFVNGQKLALGVGCPLKDGDHIDIGLYKLLFRGKVKQRPVTPPSQNSHAASA